MVKMRILSAALTMALCLGMLPVPAAAEPVDITSTGLALFPTEYGNEGPSPSAVYQAGEGTLEWDLETRTITLTNASINAAQAQYGIALELVAPGGEPAPEVTVVLHGTNTMTGKDGGFSYGINAADYPLRICGGGTLAVSGGSTSAGSSIGIECRSLTVEQGAAVNAAGGSGSISSCGVSVREGITVAGVLNASAEYSSGNSYAIGGFDAGASITVERGGVLEARGAGTSKGYGIHLNGNSDVPVTVEGTLIASGAVPFGVKSVSYQNRVVVKGTESVDGTGVFYGFQEAPTGFDASSSLKYIRIVPDEAILQDALVITGRPAGTIRYGDVFRLDVSGGSGGGAVTWAVTRGAAQVDQDGTVRVTGVGEVTVTATKDGGTAYADASADCSFTAERAVPNVGAVTCAAAAIHPGTRPEDVALSRTDLTVPGTLALSGETIFALDRTEYDWVFTPGDQTLYETLRGRISLTVTAAALDSISVAAMPDRRDYTFGDPFDPAGMVVMAAYTDGTAAAVRPDFDGSLAVGQTGILLTYSEGGITRTCMLDGLTVSKKAGMSLPLSVLVSCGDTDMQTTELDGLLPSDCGTVTGISVSADPSGIIGSAAGDRDGKRVSWALKPGLEFREQSAVLTVTVETQNYDTITIALTVRAVPKTAVAIGGVSAQDAVYDGTAHAGYTGTPRAGSYQGGFTITYSGDHPPVNAGRYTVTIAIPEEDDTFTGSLTLSFMVAKGRVAVKAEDRTVTAGSAMPELTASVTGLATGDALKTEPVLTCGADLNRPGVYPITVSGAEVPEGGNYETGIVYQPGTLTVLAAGSGGGGSSSGKGSGAAMAAPEKGSATTLVRADGTLETRVSLAAAAVAEARRTGEAVRLPVSGLPVVKRGGTAPVVIVNTGSKEPLRVEIPVQDVTPGTVALIVHPDGREEPVKMSVPTENGLTVLLDDGAVVKVVDNSREFDDVPKGWIKAAADFVSARAIFAGTARNLFSPAGRMSRSMLATVLARLDGVEASGPQALETGMSWAEEHGIADGGDPHAAVSREEMVMMLYRYAGQPEASGADLDFRDADQISEYAVDGFRWAVGAGLISGIGDKMLAPQSGATRGQAAAVIMRFCRYMAG